MFGACAFAETQPFYHFRVVREAMPVISLKDGQRTTARLTGTLLLPLAKGEANITLSGGHSQIEARFRRLEAPTRFGREYLTYVLWAMGADGCAYNLGELVADSGNNSRLRSGFPLSAFSLFVTAEPYFSVSAPGSVVVMELEAGAGTPRMQVAIPAAQEYTYDLEKARQNATLSGRAISLRNYELLLALYQVNFAIDMARAAGAERYAPREFVNALRLLAASGEYETLGREEVLRTLRQAAEAAETARAAAQKAAGTGSEKEPCPRACP